MSEIIQDPNAPLHPPLHGQGEPSVEIEYLHFIKTGTYNDMTSRPYETNVKQQITDQIMESTRGGLDINPTALAGVAGQFLRPKAQAAGVVNIEQGWDQPRLRFIMRVNIFNAAGELTNIRIIQGFTSHVGYTAHVSNVHIDPHMQLHFNTIVALRVRREVGPHGEIFHHAVESADHLLHGDFDKDYSMENHYNTRYMRPQDLFTSLSAQQHSMGGDDVYDIRTQASGQPMVKSRRKNNVASHYMSNSVNAWYKTKDYAQDAVDWSDMASHARSMVSEQDISHDRFLWILKSLSRTFQMMGYVHYGELCDIFPGVDSLTTVYRQQESPQQAPSSWPESQRGNSEYWTTVSNETIWAAILSQSVPSLMFDNLMCQVGFTATNQTTDGTTDITILSAAPIVPEQKSSSLRLNNFKERLYYEVLQGLTMNNQIDFYIQVLIDVYNDCFIHISIGGGPMVPFNNPCHCDSLFTPVVTRDRNDLDGVAHSIQMIGDSFNHPTEHVPPGYDIYSQGGPNNAI